MFFCSAKPLVNCMGKIKAFLRQGLKDFSHIPFLGKLLKNVFCPSEGIIQGERHRTQKIGDPERTKVKGLPGCR